jgi:hypothetical protein
MVPLVLSGNGKSCTARAGKHRDYPLDQAEPRASSPLVERTHLRGPASDPDARRPAFMSHDAKLEVHRRREIGERR